MRPVLAFAAAVGLATAHCGLTEPNVAVGVDGGREAGRDGGHDAQHDAARPSVDARPDVHPDAGHEDAGVDACKPKVPAQHRPTATTCSTTRPPGYNSVAGVDSGIAGAACTSDSQCTDGGVNGRCTVLNDFFAFCSYDECTMDSDCGPSSVCICGAALPAGEGRNPNQCVPAGCHVDTDCGPGGYCSPSPQPCTFRTGNFAGVAGYYCHTAKDLCAPNQCASNTDCEDAGNNCEWDASAMSWACAFGDCT